ncbi:ROK family protein [Spongiactinospora sp. TRM90649]|uniref:ROK family protein n=1 Tax=Spongiactinospora sp. TRM90649 TaxID=3031114 RepID=UPI0023F74EDD|nr:ROK family protein [Spongiactinospora sp. TRM90649]MDF5758314.1 ROK family protein [Spongiactinospora sp. TRM90649]
MNGARTSGELRAHNRVRLLRAVHDCGAARTRSQLTRDLDLARGTASVLMAGLGEDELLAEASPPRHVRGRPTGVPGPHPDGPLVLAVNLREDTWDLARCELGGGAEVVEHASHDGSPEGALGPLGAAVRAHAGPRVAGIGLAVPGPVREGRIVDIAHLRWSGVDVVDALGLGPAPLRVGNDATLAGLAEARRGRLAGVRVGLHLHVDFDPGGALLVDGRPLTGASGTAGEFGHMPIADLAERACACGARGCWSLRVGGNALLAHAGITPGGGRGRRAADRILAAAARGEPGPREAVDANARVLGAGVGALVNALDPELVTLSGMGADLLVLAGMRVRAAYRAALMGFRRADPPELAISSLGRRGPLVGAMESAFDDFLTVRGIEDWRETRERARAVT